LVSATRTPYGWDVFLDDGESLLTERSGARLAAGRAAPQGPVAGVAEDVVAHGSPAGTSVRLGRSRG
jgi:hypothetical protein